MMLVQGEIYLLWLRNRRAHVCDGLTRGECGRDFSPLHLGNASSSDRDRVAPFFERPKGRLGLSDRENYETANTLGFRIGQGTGAIRRLVRRRRDDATAPSRFGKRPRPGCPHRRGSRARVLLVASHDELAPSLSLA